MKPRLLFIAGPNGSGKTTITREVVKHDWAKAVIYVNPDDIANTKFSGWNDPLSVHAAAVEAARIRNEALRSRSDIMFETVFSAPDKAQFIMQAKRAGFFTRGFFICTENPKINASRIAGRVMEGGHDVPISKIISRYTKSIAYFSMVLPHIDRGYVFDNSLEDKTARLLFRTVDGQIFKTYSSSMPEWAMRLIEKLPIPRLNIKITHDDNFDLPEP